MKWVRYLLLVVIAICFGLCFTFSFELAFSYRDFSLALQFMVVGMVFFIVYWLLWFMPQIVSKNKEKR